MTVRVLVIDDHPLFLDGVRAALAGANDLELVGEARDGQSALAAAAELAPDVVLLDIGLPDRSGIDVAGSLLAAVRTVAGGGAVFSPAVADRLGTYFSSLSALPGMDAFPTLTDREREVLDVLARGYDNRRIARELFLSERPVRNHVSNILGKLDAESRGEAVVRARNTGLGG